MAAGGVPLRRAMLRAEVDIETGELPTAVEPDRVNQAGRRQLCIRTLGGSAGDDQPVHDGWWWSTIPWLRRISY